MSESMPSLDLGPSRPLLLGEPLEKPLAAGRRRSASEASLSSRIYARVALKHGGTLLEEIRGPNCHAAFDTTLENAMRLFDVICCPETSDISTPLCRVFERSCSGSFELGGPGPGTPTESVQALTPSQGTPKLRALNSSSSFARQRSVSLLDDAEKILMNRSQLMKALHQQGFKGLDGSLEFAELWAALGKEATQGLDYLSFHSILRHLKLHLLCGGLSASHLATPELSQLKLQEETGFVGYLDWCPRKIDDWYFRRSHKPLDMFLNHRDHRMKMRWVHCRSVGRPTILRLAVKYQLHPLPVEDTIQLQQQSVPIVRKYSDNFFIVIPLLRLTPSSRRTLARYQERRNQDDEQYFTSAPQVEQCRLALFVAGPPNYDTVISVMTDWTVSKLHADKEQPLASQGVGGLALGESSPGPAEAFSLSRTPRVVRNGNSSDACSEPSIRKELQSICEQGGAGLGLEDDGVDVFGGVVREIQRDFSMLRAGNSSWLLWRLLDVAVDELTPILSAYRAQLRWFSSLITAEEARVSVDVEKRLLQNKVELDWLQRKLRPMLRVLKHLIRDKVIDPDVTRYLEDVEDHLGTFLEEVARIIGVCNTLRDEVQHYRDRQQQKVLYVLTLVTTLVMPTHLLTGVFGMNFQNQDGKPVVPGLGPMEEKRGYLLFWGTSVSLTLSIYLTFRMVLKWI